MREDSKGMEPAQSIPVFDPDIYTTERRFNRHYSETEAALEHFREHGVVPPDQIDMVEQEDVALKVSLRTHRKCMRQFVASQICVVLGLLLGQWVPLFYFLMIGGIIVGISSFHGVRTNRISTRQKLYLRS